MENGEIVCYKLPPNRQHPSLAEDIRTCFLTDTGSRSIPSKYIYDEIGSILFENICETPEYYLTRTEEQLLIEKSEEIIRLSRPGEILELGSGSAVKTRHILNACEKLKQPCEYAPMDISETMLMDSSRKLNEEYEWLPVSPIVGDYTAGLSRLPTCDNSRLVVFLGSTVGNMKPSENQQLLSEIRSLMSKEDFFLIGLDRIKDRDMLHAAYNDKAGYSADLRYNLLRILNRELGADFNPDHYTYEVSFNEEQKRIDMLLVSNKEQRVTFSKMDDAAVVLAKDERIHTGYSHKFDDEAIDELMAAAHFRIQKHYRPDNGYFSLILATPAP